MFFPCFTKNDCRLRIMMLWKKKKSTPKTEGCSLGRRLTVCLCIWNYFFPLFFLFYFFSFIRYTTTGRWSAYPFSHCPPACVRFGVPLYFPSVWKR